MNGFGPTAVLGVGAALLHTAPAVTAIGPLRAALLPRLAGRGRPRHVALTFDDGPDPAWTPMVLDVLAEFGVRATFFALGEQLRDAPALGRAIAAGGHEFGVHGWDHRCLLWRGSRSTTADLQRTAELVTQLSGAPPRWFRPPYGVLSWAALHACRDLGLTPVLWTAWGRDWSRRATPDGIVRAVRRRSADGGTVLLHDSDCTAAPGSPSRTLAALPKLLQDWQHAGMAVGTLAEHGVGARRRAHGPTQRRENRMRQNVPAATQYQPNGRSERVAK